MTTPDDSGQRLDDSGHGTDDAGRRGRSPARIIAYVLIGVGVLAALAYGAIFFYANVINDSPDELDADDLSEALETGTSVAEASAPDPAVVATIPADVPADSAAGDTAPATGSGLDGAWVPTAESEFGYRVDEVLAGVNTTAVGRSNEISGSMTVEGSSVPSVDVEVLVENITSDDSRRDGQFRGRIMSADEFPTATFVLTEPIELGSIPADGEQVIASATGDLTLRGVTNSVTFDVTAQATGERVGVLGSIPVLFSDYGIDNPSFGTIKTEDNGLIEFVLVFERA